MPSHLLTLNTGSSSLKFALYEIPPAGAPGSPGPAKPGGSRLALRLRGDVEGVGEHGRLRMRDARGEHLCAPRELGAVADAMDAIVHALAALHEAEPALQIRGVGHRVVHGGAQFSAPTVIDAPTLSSLEKLVSLAPLHQPYNIACIRAAQHAFPDAVQVACFDTAFHRGHAFVEDIYGLPRAYYERGIRRYGFHGTSYQYIAAELPAVSPALASGRTIVAHLGSGASLCALRGGASVSSSMGFSALDGVPMGTRCGNIDPGVILWLMQEDGMDAAAISRLLYLDSGLKGISGLSADMRRLLASDSPQARDAVDYFVARVQREIGALAAVLQGVDGIVFTAGIGERSAPVRARILAGLGWLGVEADEAANTAYDGDGAARITAADSRVQAWVIPTDEEGMIARNTASFCV